MPKKDLIDYAKQYLKERGFKKVNTRWTKTEEEFTLVFYIQGSRISPSAYYIRPGVIINRFADRAGSYGHFYTELEHGLPARVLTDFEQFCSEWTDKALIRSRVEEKLAWNEQYPPEARQNMTMEELREVMATLPGYLRPLLGLRDEQILRCILENY